MNELEKAKEEAVYKYYDNEYKSADEVFDAGVKAERERIKKLIAWTSDYDLLFPNEKETK